jgi:hypothetical protein
MTAIAEAGMGQLPKIADLLEELSHKNHVTVTVYRAVTKRGANRIRRRVLHEQSHESVAQWPMLAMHDKLRMLKGDKPIWLGEAVRRTRGRAEVGHAEPPHERRDRLLRDAARVDGADDAGGLHRPVEQHERAGGDGHVERDPVEHGVATDGAAGSGRGEYTGSA